MPAELTMLREPGKHRGTHNATAAGPRAFQAFGNISLLNQGPSEDDTPAPAPAAVPPPRESRRMGRGSEIQVPGIAGAVCSHSEEVWV